MWLIIGFVVGIATLGLVLWLKRNNINVKWYEWVIGILGMLLLLFTIQNFVGSQAELQSNAGSMFLLFTGVPALILMVVSWQLVARRNRASN